MLQYISVGYNPTVFTIEIIYSTKKITYIIYNILEKVLNVQQFYMFVHEPSRIHLLMYKINIFATP